MPTENQKVRNENDKDNCEHSWMVWCIAGIMVIGNNIIQNGDILKCKKCGIEKELPIEERFIH